MSPHEEQLAFARILPIALGVLAGMFAFPVAVVSAMIH